MTKVHTGTSVLPLTVADCAYEAYECSPAANILATPMHHRSRIRILRIFSFLKFNEFYEFFFRLIKIRKKIVILQIIDV